MSQCDQTVYTRDDYRYSGHGASGFTMAYAKHQCTREALPGTTRCWQHDEARGQAALLKAWATRQRKQASRRARGRR